MVQSCIKYAQFMHNIGLYTGNMQSAYAIFKVVELSKLAELDSDLAIKTVSVLSSYISHYRYLTNLIKLQH